ncbi:MAG TPA: hypothetical protein VD884_06830 [Ohtaekwangia sp.]|nr:hypothetical protein [Ohtaekwangia sp.]
MQIMLSEFKALLHVLKENQIGLKVKTHTGWSTDYLQIIGFIASTSDQANKTFGGIVLSNMNETEGILINNISTINAFQLEQDYLNYQKDTIYHLTDMTLKALIIH